MTRDLAPLSRALSAWSGHLRATRKAPSTQTQYAYTGRLLEDFFGRYADPAGISLADLDEFLGSLPADLSPSTIRLHVSALRSFWEYGRKRYAWRDVARDLDKPRADQPILRRLTPAEVAAMLATPMPDRESVVVSVFAYTGMRRGELLALKWSAISLVDAELVIDHRYAKGRKGRVIPLADALVERLARAKDERGLAAGDDCYVLPRREGHRYGPMGGAEYPHERAGEHSVDRAIKDTAMRAGVRDAESVTSHMFRRHLAERLLDSGTSPYVVAAMLGHASIDTTAAYGGGASLRSLRAALGGLDLASGTDQPVARALRSTDPLQPALSDDDAPAQNPHNPGGDSYA